MPRRGLLLIVLLWCCCVPMARAAAPGAAATMTTTAPAQLTVAVRRHNALAGHSQDYYFLDDFRVLKPAGQQLWLLDHRPLPPGALRPHPAIFDLSPMRGGLFGDTMLEYRGQVYVTGDTWCRVDPATLTMTPLAPRDPDQPRPFGATHVLRYAVSTHYGPILWQVRDQSFHAVRVDGENSS